jgi:hypothetical protein
MKRECGECQLCCRLLPMKEVNKPAGVRCPFQRHGVGCNIYPRRPLACRLWNCQWLGGQNTGSRPDRAHLVVDIMPDYVTLTYDDGRPPVHVPVLQVWIDQAYPDAHRDHRLRRFIDGKKMPALIRRDAHDAFVIAPPSFTGGDWYESASRLATVEHTAEEKLAVLGRMTMVIEASNG